MNIPVHTHCFVFVIQEYTNGSPCVYPGDDVLQPLDGKQESLPVVGQFPNICLQEQNSSR